MSVFRTILKPTEAPFSLQKGLPMLSIGSCFAERISNWLRGLYFPVTDNPFGIVYNPISMADQLDILMKRTQFDSDWTVFHNELYHSWLHHGVFSHTDPSAFRARIEAHIQQGQQALSEAQVLILTLGTAQVFELRDSRQVVANCHKAPPQYFTPRRLSVTEIVEKLGQSLAHFRQSCPNTPVIISVSPVRHLRDGLVGNNRSKAVLILAAEALASEVPLTYYFPSYELIMDDLRDYRFYEKDLIHPNSMAFDYITEHFQQHFFDQQMQTYVRDIQQYNQQKGHRLMFPDTTEAQKFMTKTAQKRLFLIEKYPFLDENPHF